MSKLFDLSKLSLEEKIALGSGLDFWHTKAFPKAGIPSVSVADGPHGIRKQPDETDMLGVHQSLPATCFPTAALTGCSWDPTLMYRMGVAISEEARHFNVALVLGPGVNIKRNPLCGRNFEYLSEDPVLSGNMAAAQIQGIESMGVGSTVKHFALNNQEYKRFASNSIVDAQALHEIYLRSFEIAIKKGRPQAVMTAYNKINETPCSSNTWLLQDVLRKQWGYHGLTVTDWGGMSDRIKSYEAGCDLYMPGGSNFQEAEVANAIRNGVMDEDLVTQSASRVAAFAFTAAQKLVPCDVYWEEHHELACHIAEESMVLLRNEQQLLPLAEAEKPLLVGYPVKSMRIQGAGSSRINPTRQVQIKELMPNLDYAQGYDQHGNSSEELFYEAIKASKHASSVVIFAGLPESYESEGFDRDHLRLPDDQNRLISAIAQVNARVIVVLITGSVVELPWNDQVKAILYAGLPGQGGAEAIFNLLFGRINPSGKLSESWPLVQSDIVSDSYYARGKKDGHYRESHYVGYRYYQTANVPVRYAFGHGLSYTTFDVHLIEGDAKSLKVQVTNTGHRYGKAVVEVYVCPKETAGRPTHVLSTFTKVGVEPQSSVIVELELDDRAFMVFDQQWFIPNGRYDIKVGSSIYELHVGYTIDITNQFVWSTQHLPKWYQHPSGVPTHTDWQHRLGYAVIDPVIKKGSFTMENSVMEMKDHSFIMKMMYKATERVIAKPFGGRVDYSNPEFKMLMAAATDSSLFAMKISGGIKSYLLEGLLALSNGQWVTGIKLLLKRSPKGSV